MALFQFIRQLAKPLLLCATMAIATPALADHPVITEVKATKGGDGSWRFDVSVRHKDEGWDHYADRWDIISLDGKIIKSRVLAHPHENEQPFTRSLGNVSLPDTVSEVLIRAHDNVHGDGAAIRFNLETGEIEPVK